MSDQRFCIIPARAIEIDYLGTNDLRVLCYVGKHADKHGWWRLSQVQMAKALTVSRGTIYNCISRLAEAELLEKHEVETASGRDSAHFYRVIYDIGLPEDGVPSEVLETRRKRQENEAVESAENSPSDPCQLNGTPANKMAPPANPGLAPSITTLSNDPLSLSGAGAPEEGEREGSEGEGEKKTHDAAEREFWKLVKAHPDTSGMPKGRWKVEWFKLSDADRRLAAERHRAWIDLLRKQGRNHIPVLSTYFSERLFADVVVPDTPSQPDGIALSTNGKAWMAHRLWQCAHGEQGEWKPHTSFQVRQFEENPELFAADIEKAKWAHVRKLPLRLTDESRMIGDYASYVQIRVGSPEFDGWQEWHRQRGWPEIELIDRLEWIWVPCANAADFEIGQEKRRDASRHFSAGNSLPDDRLSQAKGRFE